MNDAECIEVYDHLVRILNENELSWIRVQVAEQIRLGKTVEKEIATFKESRRELTLFGTDDYHIQYKKGPKATFPVTEEYDPSERLLLLIDAIEQAIVNTAEMESHIIGYFGEQLGNDWRGIRFYSEEQDSQLIVLIGKHRHLAYKVVNSLNNFLMRFVKK